MAIQSVKSILIGVATTVIGGLLLLWWVGVIPQNQSLPSTNSGISNTTQAFSFHSPVIKNFEGNGDVIALSERFYQDTFNSKQANYIYWELVIRHSELKEDTPVTILSIYKNDKGEELARMNYEAVSLKGWKSSMFTWGWGSVESGYWKSGDHFIELYYSGNLIGSKKFHVL